MTLHKSIFVLFSFFFLQTTIAKLPTTAGEVTLFKKVKDQPQFENIPRLTKTWEGAKNPSERDSLETECKLFIIKKLREAEAPYFKVWCTRETDIILRQYNISAHLLIKTW